MGRYADRRDAGEQLASKLQHYAGREDVIVLALPKGGVPVGFEIARALGVPLDIFVVRKMGAPFNAQVALGAVGSGGVQVLNRDIIDTMKVPPAMVKTIAILERNEVMRLEHVWRGVRKPVRVAGKHVIDGLATGASMRAAIAGLRLRGPLRIVVAVPISDASVCQQLGSEVDEIVCATTPATFHSVAEGYEDFRQQSDSDVRELLEASQAPPAIPVEGP